MVMINRFILLVVVSFGVLSLSLASIAGKFDVEFYNVGQGHCVVARSLKNGILIIDAGSSSTNGVDEVTVEVNKLAQLANHIFSSINNDLQKYPLSFIITHADKDHLNLAVPILEAMQSNKHDLTKKTRFILGGEKKGYNTAEAAWLITFLNEQHIPHVFGEGFSSVMNDLLWAPPSAFSFINDQEESINFISVKRESKPLVKKQTSTKKAKIGSEDEMKNATSIVVKLTGGGKSIMITGDKTKAEIALLIGRYNKEGKLAALKSDVFLATHHGSEEDFSADWMKFVKPSCLVISAGTSSFFHPRPAAVCSKEVLDNLSPCSLQPWHPIRAYGNLSSLGSTSNLVPIASGNKDNFRSTPYSYYLTNLGIYVTADQGTIRFSFDNGAFSVMPTKQKGNHNFETALGDFLNLQKNELSLISIHNPINFPVTLLPVISLCTSLQSLDLSGCNVNDSHTDDLVKVVTILTGLSVLNIRPNSMGSGSKNKICQAWNHRGLSL